MAATATVPQYLCRCRSIGRVIPTTHAGETTMAQVRKREPTKYPGIYKETYVSSKLAIMRKLAS